MSTFQPYPFIRLTAIFILGIVSTHYLGEYFNFSFIQLGALIIIYLSLSRFDSLRFKSLIGLLALMIIFLFGHFRLKHFKDDIHEDHLIHSLVEFEAYEAIIIEEPELKANSVKVVVMITITHAQNRLEKASGRVNLYLNKDKAAHLQYGDVLLVRGQPDTMKGPANPGEFDYRNYLVYNNIFHQHFARDGFQVIGYAPPSRLINSALKLRQQCRAILTASIPNEEVRGVVLALVIGVKDELDNDLQRAYAASGAMHVLAVSGLHVGIIYGLVLLLFKSLRLNLRKWRWSLAMLSLIVLWSYAFLTGLSPSVLRAVTMFSFIALGKALHRNTNIYNTLAASAFVLLWYNPYLIMSVGFQLSYMAVFGIVYLQPKFYNWFEVKNPLLDKVWAITCVSLAAQISTGPLSVLYFHQFPSYFFLSNLFIIPAALVILVMGLSILLLAWIPLIGDALSWLLTQFVSLTNRLVFLVDIIPGSLIEGINIKTYETWMVYGSVIGLILVFSRKRFKYLIFATVMTLFFALSQIVDRASFLDRAGISFFDVSGTSVFDIQAGRQTKFIGDSLFISNEDKVRFTAQPKRLLAYQNIDLQQDQLNLASEEFVAGSFFVFQDQTYLHLREEGLDRLQIKSKLAVDAIIISNDAIKDVEHLMSQFEFNRLIIDRSNRKYWADRLTSQAEKLNLNVHSIHRDGFLEINLRE